MVKESVRNLCIYHALDGLREGLSHFSGSSRVALVHAVEPDDPMRIYDPQALLSDHEPMLKKLYLDSTDWRDMPPDFSRLESPAEIFPEPDLGLAGLITHGGRSGNIFYQMWFTEEHPDMCSTGPTECWLEHAAWLLSHDLSSEEAFRAGISGYVLREYATHAVRDYIVDELNRTVGWDVQLRIYPVLDAILGISETLEEGTAAFGRMIFIESREANGFPLLVRFPEYERPLLRHFKHVRKLLLSVESSSRYLVSNGRDILGVSRESAAPECCITADFLGRHGFLSLNEDLVCSYFDGRFLSTNRRANLVQLEETLLEMPNMDQQQVHVMFRIATEIVNSAAERKHGCTLVFDFNEEPLSLAGMHFDEPFDLRADNFLALGKALAKVDGALHIHSDFHVHGFAVILDGHAVAGEDRARGARFNSALRFTRENDNVVVVVVSEDRPVSVIQGGVELTAQCEWKPMTGKLVTSPTLEGWANR
ncbi:MAG: DNA integrity scanning protein DisA nucleotide-binding domain protein [Desulfatibacillaceae bacterium]